MEHLNQGNREHGSDPVELDAGDGVVVRERTALDDQAYLDTAQKNADNLKANLSYMEHMHTINDAIAWREDDRRTVFGIWKDDALVGEVNVGEIADKTLGIAYWVDKNYRRQGITTRAVGAVTRKYTSEGYAIEAEAASASSGRVAERLGYTALAFDPATFNGRFVFRIEPQKQHQ